MLLEAGAELSCIGANAKSLEFFGLRWMEQKRHLGTLTKLRAWGLPVMVTPDRTQLEENDHILSSKFTKPSPTCGQRRLVCAFDRTYLESAMQMLKTDRGSAFAGGNLAGFCIFGLFGGDSNPEWV